MKKNLAIILFLMGCAPQPPKDIDIPPSFYYWKTTLSLSDRERAYLDRIGVKRIYIKFADIALNPSNSQIEPYSLLKVNNSQNASGFEFVPCFFITNQVFYENTGADPDWLAERIIESYQSIVVQFSGWSEVSNEIQIDCDWTTRTRDNYFAFLTALKQHRPKNAVLSCTIRLHQYKNPTQTGTPPVDRGTLMCYNTGDIDKPSTSNSIFDPREAAPYFVQAQHYPIPLDLALPVFSWALIYREDELWRIIPETNPKNWTDTTFFESGGTMIEVKKATFRGGHYLSAGDRVRLEIITPQDLLSAMPLLKTVKTSPTPQLIFYHLDTSAMLRFDPDFIKKLCKTLVK